MGAWLRQTLTGAVLVAALAVPCAAQAAPTWTATDSLSSSALGRPQVAVAPDGMTTVVWTAQLPLRTAIVSATRPIGDPFGATETLSVAPVDPYSLTVAAASSGRVVAAWREQAPGGSWRAAAAVRENGRWQAPRLLSQDGADASDIGLAVSESGDATAIWARGGHVEAIRRPATGGWTAHADGVSPLGQTASQPRLAVDPQGDAFALWLQRSGASDVVASARRPAGGSWTLEPPLTTTSGGSSVEPVLAAGPHGRAAAAWLRPGALKVEAVTRPSGGGWGLPQALGSPSPYFDRPAVTVDGNGTATVMWTDGAGAGSSSRRQPAGGGWQAEARLVGAARAETYPPVVASSASGHAIAAWSARAAPGPPTRIEAANRAPQAAWASVQDVAEVAAGVPLPDVGVDGEGNGVVAWLADGVKVRGLDVAGPELRRLDLPATMRTGEPGTFGVAARDRWSPVAATTWDFGDGARASGAQASHAYAAPGTYRVRVTSRDTAGNETTAERTVSVTTPSHEAAPGGGPPAQPGVDPIPARKPRDPVRIRYRGAYERPGSMRRGKACRGTVKLTLKRARRVLQRRTARLDRRCRFGTTFSVSRRKLGAATQLVVVRRSRGRLTSSARIRVPGTARRRPAGRGRDDEHVAPAALQALPAPRAAGRDRLVL